MRINVSTKKSLPPFWKTNATYLVLLTTHTYNRALASGLVVALDASFRPRGSNPFLSFISSLLASKYNLPGGAEDGGPWYLTLNAEAPVKQGSMFCVF